MCLRDGRPRRRASRLFQLVNLKHLFPTTIGPWADAPPALTFGAKYTTNCLGIGGGRPDMTLLRTTGPATVDQRHVQLRGHTASSCSSSVSEGHAIFGPRPFARNVFPKSMQLRNKPASRAAGTQPSTAYRTLPSACPVTPLVMIPPHRLHSDRDVYPAMQVPKADCQKHWPVSVLPRDIFRAKWVCCAWVQVWAPVDPIQRSPSAQPCSATFPRSGGVNVCLLQSLVV